MTVLITPQMIRAAQDATECDPSECDECIAKALAAGLELAEPDIRADERRRVLAELAAEMAVSSLAFRLPAALVDDRAHAGLQLPCDVCGGPCRIDDEGAGGA